MGEMNNSPAGVRVEKGKARGLSHFYKKWLTSICRGFIKYTSLSEEPIHL